MYKWTNEQIDIHLNFYKIYILNIYKGICIDNSANSIVADPACTNTGLTKYYCDTICTTCTLEKQSRAKYKNDNTISECKYHIYWNNLL